MKKLLALFFIVTAFSSCMKIGDYRFIIHKKDGTNDTVFAATPNEGMVSVVPIWGYKLNNYYLSPQDITKIEYVGDHNIIEEQKTKP